MYKVGLTGGIGSGKTTVGKVFERLGIPVFKADDEAKKITNSDLQIIQQLKKEFGEDIYINNEINKDKLASIIFNNNNALEKVNSIIHPVVREYFIHWCNAQNSPYIVEEAAILFESGAYMEMDYTINVHADELVRIERVMKRNNASLEQVKERIKNQLSDDERNKLADITIYNNENDMILPQILRIHNDLLKRIK